MKRARGCTRKLKTYLGRVIRDIERKCTEPDETLASLLAVRSVFVPEAHRQKEGVQCS